MSLSSIFVILYETMHRCLLLGHVQSRHGLRVTVFGYWNGSKCVNTGWGRFAFEQLIEHVN